MHGRCGIIVILLSSSAVGVTPLRGQAVAGHAGIRGRISTADGRPLPGAQLLRAAASDTTRADSLGRYAIERLALGRHVFVVRSPGYDPIEMDVTLTSDTTITVDIPLEPTRSVSQTRLEQVGFLGRRRRPAQGATFLGPEEIAARTATKTSDLFEGVRDITMRQDGTIFVAYGYDGRCVMNVWVDGYQVNNVFPPQVSSGRTAYITGSSASGRRNATAPVRYTGLDELVQVRDIAAIEVYSRPARTPPEFQSSTRTQEGLQFETRSADCGALVIWSRER